MTETQEKIIEWLQRLEFTHVKPVVLLIEGNRYVGAVYTRWAIRSFYIAGDRPRNGRDTCFVFDDCPFEWYIAAYMDHYDDLMPRQQRFHPVGTTGYFKPSLPTESARTYTTLITE